MYLPTTTWSWAFMGITFVQACITLAFEAYTFATFQLDLRGDAEKQKITTAIPTFLALYIFGFLYQLFLVYDALRLKNTIQVIGLVLLNIGLLIYGAVQLETIQDAVTQLAIRDDIDLDVWYMTKPFLIAIPCVLALGTILLGFVAYRLYDEFAWTIYKHISADLRMKKRYLTYQIYITLLKFDFFFFLGFTIQFVVIVKGRTNTEFGLTIAAIPVTIFILIAAAFFTRREILSGMIAVLILFFGGLAYFVFKLVRMYTPDFEAPYIVARKELTTFAVITIVLILLTIANAIACSMNFNKGLRPYISSRKLESDEEKLSHTGVGSVPPSYSANPGSAPGYGYGYHGQNVEMVSDPYMKPGRMAPTRMEID